MGKTLAGTYAQTVEQFNQLHPAKPMDINILSDDIKKIETTVCDDFIWVDIYYVDEEAHTKDNANIEKFVVFGFEKGGNKYKRDFIITEYEKLYMTRCVFDKDAMKVLGADMMVDDITVKELFDEYAISVWATDYTTDKPLFDINGGNDVHDELEEENFGEFEDVDTNELDEVEMKSTGIMGKESARETLLKVECLKDAIHSLSDRDQSVIFMLMDGFSGREMADVLQIKEGAQRKLVSDVRGRLKRRLAEAQFADIAERTDRYRNSAVKWDAENDEEFGFLYASRSEMND